MQKKQQGFLLVKGLFLLGLPVKGLFLVRGGGGVQTLWCYNNNTKQ